jgi:sugar phosphate isomerase/epimerase
MLLTLSTRSFARHFASAPPADENGTAPANMLDMPDFAITHLQLRGMNVPASMLSGWSLQELDRFRDRADKAGCPCLVLIEDQPLPFADADDERREGAADRVRRLAAAAHRLGCNALAITFEGPDSDEAFETVAVEVKSVMPHVERLELNVLLAPHDGLTHDPDRLTDLIKRIGGFRIGSLPSFGHAAKTGDVIGTLRKLAPYAGAVHATVDGFTKGGAHRDYDLAECVSAIRSVGFVNTLAIDYLGSGDPVDHIEKARVILQEAIEAE